MRSPSITRTLAFRIYFYYTTNTTRAENKKKNLYSIKSFFTAIDDINRKKTVILLNVFNYL